MNYEQKYLKYKKKYLQLQLQLQLQKQYGGDIKYNTDYYIIFYTANNVTHKILEKRKYRYNYGVQGEEVILKSKDLEPISDLVNKLPQNTGTNYSLIFNNIRFDKKSINSFAEYLLKYPNCTSLIVTDCIIGDNGVITIANALKNNTILTILKLNSNNIGDIGVIAIADALKNNTILTTLNLNSNNIGDNGVNAIADALKNKKELVLGLGYNKITNIGIKYIGTIIDNLKILYLNHNKFNRKGVIMIAKILQNNASLERLYLGTCDIGLEGSGAIIEALIKNKTLKILNLGNSNVIDKMKLFNQSAWKTQADAIVEAGTNLELLFLGGKTLINKLL